MTNPKNIRTILWADDDPDDLYVIRELLQDTTQTFRIVECADGKEVMQQLQQMVPHQPPCLIILDMNMPVLSGREVLPLLKQCAELSTIPVVVFTTSSSELDRKYCQRFGVDMFTKPASLDRLRTVVGQLLNYCN